MHRACTLPSPVKRRATRRVFRDQADHASRGAIELAITLLELAKRIDGLWRVDDPELGYGALLVVGSKLAVNFVLRDELPFACMAACAIKRGRLLGVTFNLGSQTTAHPVEVAHEVLARPRSFPMAITVLMSLGVTSTLVGRLWLFGAFPVALIDVDVVVWHGSLSTA